MGEKLNKHNDSHPWNKATWEWRWRKREKDMQLYTEAHIREELAKAVAEAGSRKKFSDIHNIADGYVSNVLNEVTKPGPAIAIALGYQKKVVYVKKGN